MGKVLIWFVIIISTVVLCCLMKVKADRSCRGKGIPCADDVDDAMDEYEEDCKVDKVVQKRDHYGRTLFYNNRLQPLFWK